MCIRRTRPNWDNQEHSPSDLNKMFLLYKVQCFIRISGTDKNDNLTCEIIYDNFTRENYRFSNNHPSYIASGHFILVENL